MTIKNKIDGALVDRLFLILISVSLFLGCAKKSAAETGDSQEASLSQTQETPLSLQETLRNPFLTGEEADSLVDTVKIVAINYLSASAIFYSPAGKSRAIIAGRILEKGSSIDNKEIVEIQPEAIVLKDAAAEYIVKLKK